MSISAGAVFAFSCSVDCKSYAFITRFPFIGGFIALHANLTGPPVMQRVAMSLRPRQSFGAHEGT